MGELNALLTARWDEEEARYREAAGDDENRRWAREVSGNYDDAYIDAYIVDDALFHLATSRRSGRSLASTRSRTTACAALA